MKKITLLAILCFIFNNTFGQSINFTVNTVSTNTVATCANPSVVLTATSSYTAGAVTFYWANNSTTITGNTATLTAGIYTVAAVSIPNYGTQTIVVNSNTTAPVFVLTPSVANITCSGTPTTFTLNATTPSVNVSSIFMSPAGGSVTANGNLGYYTPSSPGTYTASVTNQVNGCKSSQSFTVTSNNAYPTYSINSSTGFTLGCSSKSVTTINLVNVLGGGGSLSYTLIPPGASTLVNGPFGTFSTFTANAAGVYMIMVYESGSGCTTKTPVSILQNAFAPVIDSLVNRNNILTCANPTTNLMVYNQSPTTQYVWTYNTGTVLAANCSVTANTANPTNTVVGSYTCTLTDPNNLCKTSTTTLVYQNIFKPNAKISTSTSSSTNTTTCLTPSLMLVNTSTSGIPLNSGFSVILPVIGLVWNGPSPQIPVSNSSTYTPLVAGVYTMTAKDLNNGCTADAVFFVSDCLGVRSQIKQDAISFYPNPVKDLLNLVSVGNSNIQITDILGNVLFKGEIDNQQETLDVSAYPRGLYFISVLQNKQVVKNYRLVKD